MKEEPFPPHSRDFGNFRQIDPKIRGLWKNEKFFLTEKKFRQINHLLISLVKPLPCFHEILAKKV